MNQPTRVVFLILAALLLAASSPAAATDHPVTVSPGHPSRLIPIDDRCPTFSWGQVDGAMRYELVVYRAADLSDGEEGAIVLRQIVDGGAAAWTPPIGRCLERGEPYAWSLRAHLLARASEWSVPALFQVLAGPEPGEIEEALALVRELVARRPPAAGGTTASGAPGGRTAPVGKRRGAAESGGSSAGPRPAAAEDPVSADRDPEILSLGVEGRIEAAAFSGDGSALANVAAVELACADCVDGEQIADGAVTAAKIGAACAAGQVLMRGAAAWECATMTAPACTPGDEVGCYTGPSGTRGIGECTGGIRICGGDSSWGGCSGEVLPAAAELCDGLDNTCDGTVDVGDPATLCPPTANVTATDCGEGACSITGCAADWFDTDGVYANGCEAPGPGLCLEGGVPRAVTPPAEGQLVIQELLADPASPLGDADAEWFEVAVKASFDLNGLVLGTTFGTSVDQIESTDCLTVQEGELLLFARTADPASNGNLAADFTFGFSLVNGGGELHLAHDGGLIDAVSWVSGNVSAGRSRNLPPGGQDATVNDDQANWCTVPADAGLEYSPGNHGTPGSTNVDCP